MRSLSPTHYRGGLPLVPPVREESQEIAKGVAKGVRIPYNEFKRRDPSPLLF